MAKGVILVKFSKGRTIHKEEVYGDEQNREALMRRAMDHKRIKLADRTACKFISSKLIKEIQ